ncbi:hypothetical protein [Croceicoccus sediminis]|uniref:hypothetical protein n=1 Tax=Croceicoccus sediminis TaxID=2571150 RepID=UPI001183DB39|nr:hypothetical protein [Croceicoccus sediminis]
MKKLLIGAGLLSLAVSHPAFAEDQPVTLEKSSPWVMDYAEDSCKLRAAFKSDAGDDQEKPYVLEFQQYGPGADFDVMVYGKGLKLRDDGKFTMRWSDDAPDQELQAMSLIEVDGQKGFVFKSTLIDPDIKESETAPALITELSQAAETKVDGLYLLKGPRSKVFFKTGNLRAAFDAMRTCTDELTQHWGLDAAAYKARTRSPKPIDYEKWTKRFFELFFRRQEKGTFARFHNRVRLMIDETGAVSSCHSQFRIEPEELMEESCQLLKKVARFEPALGSDGLPIKGVYQLTVFAFQD